MNKTRGMQIIHNSGDLFLNIEQGEATGSQPAGAMGASLLIFVSRA